NQCTALDRQRHASDEIGFVGSEKQRCIRDVPCRSHPATQRNLGIALRSNLGAAAVASPSARVDGHWRIHESWQDAVGANAVWSVLQSKLLGEGDHCRFGRLVGDEGVAVLARSHRRNATRRIKSPFAEPFVWPRRRSRCLITSRSSRFSPIAQRSFFFSIPAPRQPY